MCSPWTKKTDSVHIYLDRTNNASKTCSCTIEGDTENTKMAIVDYRPYTGNSSCAGSSVIVDGEDMLQCTENGTYFSVLNKNITIINNVTKIAVSFSDDLPQMLWLHVKGINMTVQCGNKNISSTFPSSSPTSISTIDTISTDTLTTSPEKDTSRVTTNTESNTVTTTLSLSYEENEHENVFSLLVIAGGSTGLLAVVVIITVTICFLCRRKSNRTTKDKNKENMYAEYNAQSNTANIFNLTIKSGVINQGYETENKIGDFEIKDLSNSNYEEVGKKKEESDDGSCDDNVYAEPADVADNMYAETSETENLRPQTEQSKFEGVNYTEPYGKFVITDNGSQTNYAKVIKSERKKDAYDTCAGIDNYSHILIDMKKQIPKTEDTYSHMEFPGKNHDTSCLDNYSHTKVRPWDRSKVQKCTGMYINVKINTTQQDLMDRETVIKESDNNSASLEEEEGEYDHLDHLSYHSVI
ncbi:uncharacterized protein LOC132733277 [Ruditapes philippinarum]|uniref:uncharacterized protein LOC132733277 n=1 Tax=Ruditapes philippinarum TaxID=129788 RepID=UPI00295ACAC5|nr:uncharacterized protein LOC132733277 [Ruditapes philippinarum]